MSSNRDMTLQLPRTLVLAQIKNRKVDAPLLGRQVFLIFSEGRAMENG
jgi:hypothetical protein